MRTTSTGQKLRLRSPKRVTRVRVEIQDDVGNWRDWTNLFGRGLVDLIESVEWGEDLDSPGIAGTVRFYWRRYFDNGSPFVGNTRISNWFNVGRGLRIYTEVLPDPLEPVGNDEQLMVDAVIDQFDLSSYPGTLTFRDAIVADLMDQWIEQDVTYGAGDPPMETFLQTILNNHVTPSPVLYTPVSPGFAMLASNFQPQVVHNLLKATWLLIGWDCRPKWDGGTGMFRLTLYSPDRNKTVPDDFIERQHYRAVTSFGINIADIRNVIEVYYDSGSTGSGGERNLQLVTREDGISIAKYRRRWMQVVEGATNGINTLAEAEAFADAILSDLSEPDLDASFELDYWWPTELNDLHEYEADGERFGENQKVFVQAYTHRISANDAVTSVTVAGKARSGKKVWLEREARPGQAVPKDTAAPAAPSPTFEEGPLHIGASFGWPGAGDWDVVEMHEGDADDFVPSLATLVDQTRSTRATRRKGKGKKWYKLAVRDKEGNRSSTSAAQFKGPTGVKRVHLADELLHGVKVRPDQDRTPSPSPVILPFDEHEWGEVSMFDDGNDLVQVSYAGVYSLHAEVTPGGSQDLTSWRVRIIKDPGGTPVVLSDSGVLTDVDAKVVLMVDVALVVNDQVSVEIIYVGSTLSVAHVGTFLSIKPTLLGG